MLFERGPRPTSSFLRLPVATTGSTAAAAAWGTAEKPRLAGAAGMPWPARADPLSSPATALAGPRRIADSIAGCFDDAAGGARPPTCIAVAGEDGAYGFG